MESLKLLKEGFDSFIDELNINESPLTSFNADELLNDKYIQNFINNDDAGQSMLDNYIMMNELGDEDEEEIRNSSEFRDYVVDELSSNLDSALYNIERRINNGLIPIYRAITIEKNWIQHLKTQGKRLGIYWAWDEDSAETHWGDTSKPNVAVIETAINEKYIDWKETLEMNMSPNYGDEKEIRLFKNTPINIKSIKINDKEIDISILGNKTFYA